MGELKKAVEMIVSIDV